MISRPTHKILPALLGLLSVGLILGVIGSAYAATSQKVDSGACLTTGGGRIVSIPRFAGEEIDRRLLRDVRYLVRKYKIFVTDGYSTSPVHSANGEHPVGLALDIIPDASKGGTWSDIDRLARWAEPEQNQTRPPFRWVGYDGDANHGRGHHLHLSWNSVGKHRFGKPMKSVFSIKCPSAGSKPTPAEPSPAPAQPKEPAKSGPGKKSTKRSPKKGAGRKPQPPPKTGGLVSDHSPKGKKGSPGKGRNGKGKNRSATPVDELDIRSGGLVAAARASHTRPLADGITPTEWERATEGAVAESAGIDR